MKVELEEVKNYKNIDEFIFRVKEDIKSNCGSNIFHIKTNKDMFMINKEITSCIDAKQQKFILSAMKKYIIDYYRN
ncbi:hypothetical protein I0Q91_12270 [Halanaerobiaceae bacterium Z-7014]|uniref:Uncharacterized protein n=1 Tax=Halonatronomonas betaini TaxID=2778430 RepID=A0A931FAQ7_9FIRM|nr:hypothetical protein [Halonatronomonas betaini]MBF8437864.1 hypothetical protein [Halonatronomonas betaini]